MVNLTLSKSLHRLSKEVGPALLILIFTAVAKASF